MQEVREAIETVLQNDATVIGLLGQGAASIVNERDLIAGGVTYPAIAVTTQGAHPFKANTPHMQVESWTLRVYDQNYGYYRIDEIRARCKKLFHRQPLALTTPNLGVQDVNFAWDTPDYYDDKFRAENAGIRFHIVVVNFDPAFANG